MSPLLIAKGDDLRLPGTLPPSPIQGVSPKKWWTFVDALTTQEVGSVTRSGNLGCFEMRPRRLEDIGLMTGVRSERRDGVRVWRGEFRPPDTRESFLASYLAQYNALVKSVLAHLSVPRRDGVSLSGHLAVLHRAGVDGLRRFLEGRRFDRTVEIFERANKIF